jgi:hypothetical protein
MAAVSAAERCVCRITQLHVLSQMCQRRDRAVHFFASDSVLFRGTISAGKGPAGLELGTDSVHFTSLPVETGIIAGTRSQPLIGRLLPSPNDGKVSVASTRLDGMKDFRTLPVSHTFMMNKRATLRLVTSFLLEGHFCPSECG